MEFRIALTSMILAVGTEAMAECPSKGVVTIAETTSGQGIDVDVSISDLDLSGRGLVALLPELVCLTDLQVLNLAENQALSELSLAGMTKLYSLDVSHTKLDPARLDFASAPLVILRMNGLGVPRLGPALPRSLMELAVSYNGLQELDVSSLPHLSHLEAAGNALTHLDLSQNPDLYVLDVSHNSLATVDLSAQRGLARADLTGNLLPPATP